MLSIFKRKNGSALSAADQSGESGGKLDEDRLELTHVGPYRIIAPIGAGGMGKVYKAIDPRRDQTIAVKVLDSRYDVDKKARKRDYLGREIMIAAQLNHPNIIRMHPQLVTETDAAGRQRRCLLMEYIDGHDLKKHITDRDLSLRQMVDLCIQICQGLDFLHQNLFSRDARQVKIVDFGLSKSNATWLDRWTKETGGTRLYMSPEQLKKQKLDERSDIFSLGITMYELFTGRHPCNGQDSRQIMNQLRDPRYRFEPPSKHNHEIPHALDKIILKALRRKADHRYQSVTEMLLDLTRLAEARI